MGHGSSEDVTTVVEPDGVAVVSAYFQMGGSWVLTGLVGTGALTPEGFSADIEAFE